MLRIARGLGIGLAALVLLLLITFAIPVPVWRTGELPAPPLPLAAGGPAVGLSARIWIDTDAACGHGPTADPDDCFAILLLARRPDLTIAGISTVHGNAPLDVTDRTTRALMAMLKEAGTSPPPVYRGSAATLGGNAAPAPAHAALRRALEDGPLTLIALGPLTNVAAALRDRADLRARVVRLVAVMGRRLGHLFHPAEGAGGGLLFGHGPVFRDFNFDQDRRAATAVVRMGLPMTFIPYEAARGVSISGEDLARLAARPDAAWVAARARGWLDFWKNDIGREGFYPFDLLAGAYLIAPRLFNCAEVNAWVGKDDRLWNVFHDPDALLVGLERERPAQVRAGGTAVYCPEVDAGLHSWLMAQLAAAKNPP